MPDMLRCIHLPSHLLTPTQILQYDFHPRPASIPLHSPLRPRRPLIIPQRPLPRRTRARAEPIHRRIYRHRSAALRPAVNMVIIPHLVHHRPSAAGPVRPRPGTAHVRHCAELGLERALDGAQGISRRVRGHDARGLEPVVGRQAEVELDGGLEEVDDVRVRRVLRAVAG